jgi:hypothetical protein
VIEGDRLDRPAAQVAEAGLLHRGDLAVHVGHSRGRDGRVVDGVQDAPGGMGPLDHRVVGDQQQALRVGQMRVGQRVTDPGETITALQQQPLLVRVLGRLGLAVGLPQRP